MGISPNPEFESGVISLDTPVIGGGTSTFDRDFGVAEKESVQESTIPKKVELSEANVIKEIEQAEISVGLNPLKLSGFIKSEAEDEEAKSSIDTLESSFGLSKRMVTDPVQLASRSESFKLSSELKGLDLDKKDDTIDAQGAGEDNKVDASYMPDTGFDVILEAGAQRVWDYTKGLYNEYYGSEYAGQDVVTTSPKGPSFLGSGVNLANYTKPFATSLAYTAAGVPAMGATQASIGLSSAPPASLAGQPAVTGQAGSASTLSTLGQLASVWAIYQGIKAGGQGYVDAAMAASILATGGATAIPVAIISGLRALFGMSKRGKQKVPFGGADLQAQGGKLQAKGGYGYNNYNVKAGQAGAASVADYVNTYVRYFGLGFNANSWNQAVKDDPRMGRYDTMNDSGYADPSVLIRKVFETSGIISGNPSVGGIPITSQEQYEQATKDFNEHYTKTAIKRGGLYHANLAASDQVDFSNLKREGVPDQINFAQQYTAQERKGRQELTTTTLPGPEGKRQVGHWKPGGRAGPTWVPYSGPTHIPQGHQGVSPIPIKLWDEDVTSPYDVLYYNLVGKFNRGQHATGY